MSIIKINAITVPPDGGDELAQRFAARAGAVDNQPGFEGFELLRPTDGRHTWLVITRWADENSFESWRSGQDFQRAHYGGAADASPAGKAAAAGQPAGKQSADKQPAGQQPAGQQPDGPKHPVGMSAELWSFDIATGSRPN